jgi:hypothetical protein
VYFEIAGRSGPVFKEKLTQDIEIQVRKLRGSWAFVQIGRSIPYVKG